MTLLRLCRVLNESKPKAQLELGTNQSGTLNECKPKAQQEFSERDKQSVLITKRLLKPEQL